MSFQQTNNHYAEGIETLDLETAFRHDWNQLEYVRIAVVPEDARGEQGTISFTLVHFGHNWHCKTLQACLTAEEIDMVIEGLQKAKERLVQYR